MLISGLICDIFQTVSKLFFALIIFFLSSQIFQASEEKWLKLKKFFFAGATVTQCSSSTCGLRGQEWHHSFRQWQTVPQDLHTSLQPCQVKGWIQKQSLELACVCSNCLKNRFQIMEVVFHGIGEDVWCISLFLFRFAVILRNLYLWLLKKMNFRA